MTAATQLSIYNGCLRVCKDKQITALNVDEERRYVLDDIWNDGFVDACLEMGAWKFARRDVQIDQTSTPTVGWKYGFAVPADLKRVYMVSADKYFNQPLLEYANAGAKFLANIPTIYVSYISNDVAYGGLLSLWTEAFKTFTHHEMALRAVGRLTGANTDLETVVSLHKIAKRNALNLDAEREPSKFPAEASWAAARRGIGVRSRNPSDFM